MLERFGFRSRAAILAKAGVVSVVFFAIAPSGTQTAIANGDTRTIRLYHTHTKEVIEATYKVDGRYDTAVLQQLNWFLRDWRRDEPTTMDPRLFDVVWEVYRAAGAGREPVTVMSAYRSPETNAMLRRRSRAVAEYSQHMLGKAMDTSMPGMSMEQIREIGMKAQRGGVGYYPTAGTPFVHLDVGSVRSWPRMSYDQLVRLFPDGKTVHLPTNNQPLARYEEARAEIAAGGTAIAPPSSRSGNFFAWLFGGGTRDGDDDDASQARVQTASAARRGRAPVQVASVAQRPPVSASSYASAASTNYNDAGRDFFATEAARSYAPARAPDPVPVQPPPPVAQAPAAPRETAPVAAEPPRTAVAAFDPAAAMDETASDAFAGHPPPPRRPVELAAFEAPLPPVRPVELASLGTRPSLSPSASAYAGLDAGPRRDPIGAMIDREAVASTKPADRKPVGRPVAVATIGPVTGLRAARADTPPIVPARLDRSNFRAMTAQQPAARMTTQTVAGPTIVAPRPAARADPAMLAPVASGSESRFGHHATDLPTGGFAAQHSLRAAAKQPAIR